MRRALFVALVALCGCAGLIGVPDLTFDENASQDGGDGSTPQQQGDGGLPPDGAPATDPDGAPITCNADLKTSKQHCGACGHDCTNGLCNDGVCTLTPDLGGARALALSGNTLYIGLVGELANNGIVSCPTNGCASETVGVTQVSQPDAGYLEVFSIAATPQYVFAADYYDDPAGALARVSIAAGAVLPGPVSLVPSSTPQGRTDTVAADDGKVYWTHVTDAASGGGLWSCDLPACTSPVKIAAGESPEVVVADRGASTSGRLFFSDNGGYELKMCAKGAPCPTPTVIPNTGYINDFAVEGERVYVAHSAGTIESCSLNPVCTNPVLVVEEPDPLSVTAIAVRDGTIYWSTLPFDDTQEFNWRNDEGVVKSCSAANCTATTRTIATGQKAPELIVVDDRSVYWSNGGKRGYTDGFAAVMKAPR